MVEPMELTARQHRALRAAGRNLAVTVQVGKAGLTDAFVATLDERIRQSELVKVRLPAGPAPQRTELAEQMARATGAACVSVVGRSAVFYRPNADLPDDWRVPLD